MLTRRKMYRYVFAAMALGVIAGGILSFVGTRPFKNAPNAFSLPVEKARK